MSVATKEELIRLIQSHDAELKAFGVKRLGLFGSFVRNEPKYAGVNFRVVWETITLDLPDLTSTDQFPA